MRVMKLASALALLLISSVTVHASEGETDTVPAGHRISNGVIAVATCKRDAGAVCSIVYDGQELVNDFDHGRQLQVAWTFNGQGEAYNPTEAGSGDDYTKPSSTSQLLYVRIEDDTLITESHPAYWRRPGKGVNTVPVTRDTLKKRITLGYGGDSHVMAFDTTVTVSPELTGPPVKRIRVEAPTFYTSSILTDHYQFDRRNGAVGNIRLPAAPEVRDRLNTRMGLNTDHELVPVLTSADGRYAVALYTPQGENFWTYSSYNVPSGRPDNACGKLTTRFDHPAQVGRTYSYRTFVVIGDFATVIDSLRKLPSQVMQDSRSHISQGSNHE